MRAAIRLPIVCGQVNLFSSEIPAHGMADDSEAVVDLDTSAEEQNADDSAVDVDHHEEEGGDGQGDESLTHEDHGESDGELHETGPDEQVAAGDEQVAAGEGDEEREDHEENRSEAPDVEASLDESMEQQSLDDPIAAQVRAAIFMVFDSIDPDQPLDVFVKLAADVICKMVCSGTPATSVGVALEIENGALRFISLAEKAAEDSVEIASDIDRVLPPSSGVLHACLSQNAVIAIPDVLEEPSVHFFTGQRRAGSLVAMPFADESHATRGVICMDSCPPAAAPSPDAAAAGSDLLEQAALLQEEAEAMQAEADEVAADPDASEEDKLAAATAADEAKERAASAAAAAEAHVAAPDAVSDPDHPAPAPATFNEDNISILEVMAHELSRAISMLHQRHSKTSAAAAEPLDSTYGSDVVPDSPQPADDSLQSPEGDYEEEEMDADALAAYEEQEAHRCTREFRLYFW